MIHTRPSTIFKSDAAGRFEGIAWALASTPDREGDLILPSALEVAAKAAPWPVLVEHAGDPVGEVEAADCTADGLHVVGRIDTSSAAYARVKSGELSGLSMGFRGIAEASGPARIFTRVDLAEVSVCRSPINAGSRVAAIKAWTELADERELVALLKSTGMPNRLAAKVASAGWPLIQKNHQEPDETLLRALRRLASIT